VLPKMTFAIINPRRLILPAAAFADRMKFSALLWFIGACWSVVRSIVRSPIFVWGPDGVFLQ